MINRIAPKIEERIRYSIVRSIINALEEQFYPPEDMFREDFVKSVEEAEKDKGMVFKDVRDLEAYLKSLASE
ncbi:MAG TPA: hypothetical protein EYP21_07430 [Syntrophaceae bacterium]|nr:hypothetical protein [Syntrophaceae bacterium]